jgi:hypothetical protein
VAHTAAKRQQQDKSKGNDGLAYLNPKRLPGPEKGHAWQGMAAKTKYICHSGKDSDHIPGCDQAQADICRNTGRLFAPQGGQADIAPNADPCQPNQENRNLHKTNDWAAVDTK